MSDRADNDLRQVAIDFTAPTVRARAHELSASAGRFLVFYVAPGDVVQDTKRGDCCLRVGDESRRLSYHQGQEMERDRGGACFDGTASPGIELVDLDAGLLAVYQYQDNLGSTSPELALRAWDLLTRDGQVTVAAHLLFAERPQGTYPSVHVRVLKYTVTERGPGRNQLLEGGADIRCEGTIPEQIARAMAAMETLLPRRRALTDSDRFEGTPYEPERCLVGGVGECCGAPVMRYLWRSCADRNLPKPSRNHQPWTIPGSDRPSDP